VQGTGPLRFAVYLHFYDPQRPLLWQGGELTCPPVQEAPVRLMAYKSVVETSPFHQQSGRQCKRPVFVNFTRGSSIHSQRVGFTSSA